MNLLHKINNCVGLLYIEARLISTQEDLMNFWIRVNLNVRSYEFLKLYNIHRINVLIKILEKSNNFWNFLDDIVKVFLMIQLNMIFTASYSDLRSEKTGWHAPWLLSPPLRTISFWDLGIGWTVHMSKDYARSCSRPAIDFVAGEPTFLWFSVAGGLQTLKFAFPVGYLSDFSGPIVCSVELRLSRVVPIVQHHRPR